MKNTIKHKIGLNPATRFGGAVSFSLGESGYEVKSSYEVWGSYSRAPPAGSGAEPRKL